MSNTGRQSMTDKVSAALKPDSQKSTTEHMGDSIKGKTDSAASTAQPESNKSMSQKAGDMLSGNSNEDDESMLDKAKNAMGVGQQK